MDHGTRYPSWGFKKAVRYIYHQYHFVGLRAIQNLAMEIRYTQILLCPPFCFYPLQLKKQGTVVYSKLCGRHTRKKVACVLYDRHSDDKVSSTISAMRVAKHASVLSLESPSLVDQRFYGINEG